MAKKEEPKIYDDLKVRSSNDQIDLEMRLLTENGKITIDGFDFEFKCTKKNKNKRIRIRYDRGQTPFYMNLFFRISRFFELDYGFSLNSAKLDLYGSKTATKEICESMAALRHTRDYCKNLIDNDNILCLIVGDGLGPKTGILFAAKTKWCVHSIDPIMHEKWIREPQSGTIQVLRPGFAGLVPNLTCHRALVEDVDDSLFNANPNIKAIIIIGVHSHADLNNLWLKTIAKFNQKPIFLLSIPCCKGYEHYVKNVDPILNITDTGIPSLKNQVMAWHHNWQLVVQNNTY